jgi:hypothetical protein
MSICQKVAEWVCPSKAARKVARSRTPDPVAVVPERPKQPSVAQLSSRERRALKRQEIFAGVVKSHSDPAGWIPDDIIGVIVPFLGNRFALTRSASHLAKDVSVFFLITFSLQLSSCQPQVAPKDSIRFRTS